MVEVRFECECREELSARFYDGGEDTEFVECPGECKHVYVVARPFIGSLKGMSEAAQEVLHPEADQG